MRKANIEIRTQASKVGVYLYEVAAKLGMNDGNFSRLLRFELSENKKAEILSIIKEVAREQKNDAN